MQSLHVPCLSPDAVEALTVLSEDDRDVSPSRQKSRRKGKRKVSVLSSRDSEKSKSRTRKGGSPATRTVPKKVQSLTLTVVPDAKSSDSNHRSPPNDSPEEIQDDVATAALFIKQLTLDETFVAERFQVNTTDDTQDDEIDLATNDEASAIAKPDERNLILAEKLSQDDQIDILGIINLSSMNLTDQDVPAILQRAFRSKKKSCIGLILRDNALTSVGVKLLVDRLLVSSVHFRYISLSNNVGVKDAGIEQLARLVRKSRSLTFLALPDTGMTDRGVRLLADALCNTAEKSSSAPLEKLYISFNKLITDESVPALTEILQNNQTLKVLSLQHCSLSEKARQRLRQVGLKKKKRKFSLVE